MTRTGTHSDGYEDVVHVLRAMSLLDPADPRFGTLRDHVVTRCLPLAEHVARRFGGRGEGHDDLVQVARLGLVNAVDRFDTDVGGDFVAFAVPTMIGEVRRYFRDAGWSVRVPRRLKEIHQQVRRAAETLSQELGRAPTRREIADELEVDEATVTAGVLAGHAYRTVSLDTAVRDRAGPTWSETVGEDDSRLRAVENHEALRPVLAELPARERRIIVLRYYADLTQGRIAEEVGISQMHVSRLLSRSLTTLREQFGT